MSKLVTGDGRTHIESALMRESLVDRGVIAKTRLRARARRSSPTSTLVEHRRPVDLRPRQGRRAAAGRGARRERARAEAQAWCSASAAARACATPCRIALDLGLPTGGIAQLVGAMEEANAVFLNALLAKHGSIVDAARALLGAAALPRERDAPDRHLDPAVPLLGAAARGRPAARPRLATSASSSTPRCSACEKHHLREGRGRPLRQGSRRSTPTRKLHRRDHARRAAAQNMPEELHPRPAAVRRPGRRARHVEPRPDRQRARARASSPRRSPAKTSAPSSREGVRRP